MTTKQAPNATELMMGLMKEAYNEAKTTTAPSGTPSAKYIATNLNDAGGFIGAILEADDTIIARVDKISKYKPYFVARPNGLTFNAQVNHSDNKGTSIVVTGALPENVDPASFNLVLEKTW